MTGLKVFRPRFRTGATPFRLDQDGRTVGGVSVVGPRGATGFQIFAQESAEINSPITGIPTPRMTVFFRAGDLLGLYTVTFSLSGGNTVTMFVDVVE